jgi:hypothetical protein
MMCHRCHGLLINDRSDLINHYALSEASGYVGPTIRCINCGYLEDPVVRANRLRLPVVDKVAVPRTRVTC